MNRYPLNDQELYNSSDKIDSIKADAKFTASHRRLLNEQSRVSNDDNG